MKVKNQRYNNVEVPILDSSVPDKLVTATFALG